MVILSWNFSSFYPGSDKILYSNTSNEQIENLEAIETTVREQTLKYISPKIALFFSKNRLRTSKGRKRKIKSCLGDLNITTTQSNRLGLSSYQRYSPLLELTFHGKSQTP